MNIQIIIVTYNAMKWAEKCFSSLRKSSIPVATIVVDNGSTDGTQDYIQKNFPEVEFIQSKENLGFGKANNLGIERAYEKGADFFYLMNQDAWIFEDSFEKMLKVYDHHPKKEEIGVISPMHLDGSERLFDRHFENYLAKCTSENRLFSDIFCENLKSSYELDFVNAAHWLLPKSSIKNIGGFNPFFFHGAEDYDYINRVKYHDKKIILSTESKVVHDAIQDYKKTDPAERLKNSRISIRMQRETRYMNPNFDYNTQREKKEFYSNIIKLFLKGNIDESQFYLKMFKHFKPIFKEVEKLRPIAKEEKFAFLNIKK